MEEIMAGISVIIVFISNTHGEMALWLRTLAVKA